MADLTAIAESFLSVLPPADPRYQWAKEWLEWQKQFKEQSK